MIGIIRVVFTLLIVGISLNAKSDSHKISLQLLWKHQFEFAGFYIAKEKGFYKDAGIEVDIKEYDFGTNIVNDVLTGKSDIGIGRSSLVLDKLSGKEVVLLSALYQSSPYVLISKQRPDLQKIKDFKNKKIMLSDDLESIAAISSMMKIKNIYNTDYKQVKHSFNIQDLIDDKVDLMTTYLSNEPFHLKEKGVDFKIFDPKDFGFDFYADIVFTSHKYKDKNHINLKKFHDASLKGWEYAFSNIDKTVEIIFKKYNSQKKSKEALKYEANILKKLAYQENVKFGDLDEIRINEIANIYKLLGMSSKTNKYLKDIIYKPYRINKLSQKELQYLEENKVIKMCNNPNWEPIEFEDKNNNQKGITFDTMKLLEKKLDGKIKFEHVHTTSWSQSQQFLKEKKCDILSAAIKTKKREEYANFTDPYLDYKLAIITKNDKPFIDNIEEIINENRSISRKKSSGLISKLKKRYPNVKIIETKDYLESLQKVSSGEVYCTIATLPVASYYINKFALHNLHIAGYTNMRYHLSVAVRDDKPELLSILNKTLSTITQEENKNIFNRWANVQIKEKFNWEEFTKWILLLSLVILIVIYRQYFLKRQNKKLERLVNKKTKELQDNNRELRKQSEILAQKNAELEESEYELQLLNESLGTKIEEEVEKNQVSQEKLFESRRMASMGEMIGNIAHQWRQPLSVVSMGATGMQMQSELDILTKESIKETCEVINKNAQYLSKTIDDFKNFIKNDRKLELFNLEDNIDNFIQLVNPAVSNNHLNIILDLQKNINIRCYPNELMQCFINIFNNSKDVLRKLDEKDRYIFITTYEEDKEFVIKIKDSGGGIPDDVLPKIFEPYFTTKHQSQGTGLGLHMTYTLIVDGMNGKIKAKNVTYNYNDHDYTGAQFTIKLPLSQ